MIKQQAWKQLQNTRMCKVIAAGIKQTQLTENVSFAEEETIEWGLQVAKEVALSSLIIERDC